MHSYLVTVQSLEIDQDGVSIETIDYLASFESEQNKFSLQQNYDSLVGEGFKVVYYAKTTVKNILKGFQCWRLSNYTEIEDEF